MDDPKAAATRWLETGTPCQLDLTFGRSRRQRTELTQQRVAYPWSLTQPFYDTGDRAGIASVIPQSSSGGLFAGQRLRQHVRLGDNAAAMISTQGATLVHRCPDDMTVRSTWLLDIDDGARLECLNDPLVLGPQASLDQVWDVTVASSARLLLIDGWTWLAGQPDNPFLRFCSTLFLRSPSGKVKAFERSEVTPAMLQRMQATAPRLIKAFGTAIISTAGDSAREDALRAQLRDALAPIQTSWTGVTPLPNGMGTVIKLVATSPSQLAPWSSSLWRTLRAFDSLAAPTSRRRGL